MAHRAGGIRLDGNTAGPAGESLCLPVAPVGRHGRSGCERHAKGPRQHFEHRRPIATLSAAARDACRSLRQEIGTRDFEPGEYLGKPTARLLAPGERVDATLQILDPGKSAEGFEIDVCLRGVEQKISCAADAAPQSKQ